MTAKKNWSVPHRLGRAIRQYRYYYMMLIPGIIFIILFAYLPMAGTVIAFQDFKIFQGVIGSDWIGFGNFRTLFETPDFYHKLMNTLLISLYKILFGFPVPILLALMINEVRNVLFKRTVQTVVYLPHFISWVIISILVTQLLSPSDGAINHLIQAFGGKPVMFLGEPAYFRSILVLTDIWKESGWGAIIYLAALTGVPTDLYEAATIDGASKLQKILRISLPSIFPTITVMLLLRVGGILNAGFDQIFAMYNPAVYDVADVLDTYVYRLGIVQTKYGFTTAVGLFKSVVACTLLVSCNQISKKLGQESLF